MYALWLLLDPDNQISAMSLETGDDVSADARSGGHRFYQLKLHGGTPPKLTLRSPDLWKSIHGWSDLMPTLLNSDGYFLLVTTAEVSATTSLDYLAINDPNRPGGQRRKYTRALGELVSIAEAIQREYRGGQKKHKKLIQGCEAFLNLSQNHRKELVRRIRLCPSAWHIDDASSRIIERLGIVPVSHREAVARGLLEWWLLRTVRSLTGEEPRLLQADEVRRKVADLIADYVSKERLSSDFYMKVPPATPAGLSTMAKQISLVEGGQHRLERAVEHYWQSRNQRRRWIETGQVTASEMASFDEALAHEWRFEWGRTIDDLGDGATPTQEVAAGRRVLDWAGDERNGAPACVRPHNTFTRAYFTHGTCQYLSDQKKIGWHPRYKTLLGTK